MTDLPEDPFEGKEWFDFAKDFLADAAPKIDASALTMHFAPDSDDIDPRTAIQLGYSILRSKPILVAKEPGQQLPPKLAAIADEVVELDFNNADGTAQAIRDAMDRMDL